MEYLALVAEIETLRAENESLRAQLQPMVSKKPARIQCPHTTSKGTPCKKYCAPNLNTCKVHGKPKVHCTGLNMRGNPCKRKVLPDCTYCERHDPSVPVKKQKNKVVPEHNHVITPGVTEAKWVDEAEFWARRGGLR